MNRYPLDSAGIHDLASDVIRSSNVQNHIIGKLSNFLREAMTYVPDERQDWYVEADELIQEIHRRKIDFENLRFDQHNGHKLEQKSPYEDDVQLNPGMNIELEHELNTVEEDFGESMSEEELAAYFKEPLPKKAKKEAVKPIDKMSLEEIQDWESKQDNSNDIYKISARVKNLARSDGQAALTPVGDALCNIYTHVLKSFYDFADTIQDKETKIRLIKLIQSQEGMPGNVISAGIGTKGNKKQ
jgi:uncharacterized protein (UPF0305 family)